VSRVLNNKPDVNTRTREKVLTIIRASGYKKKMLQRTQPFIGVVGSFRGREQDHYFSRILAGIEQALWQFGGMPLIITQAALYRMINENGEEGLAERLDGLIWISRSPDRDLLESVKNSGIPMALINHEIKNISHVSSDRLKAMSDAVQYLGRNGHSLIAYLGNENMRMADTFRKSMKENNLTVYGEWMVCDPGEENREEGRSGTARIFGQQNRPTAMILSSDTMAPGVYEKLMELNLCIPSDVSLISFGDYPLADYLNPGLSTYRQPLFQMGEEAATAIINNLDSQSESVESLINKQLRMPFVSRSSVKNLYH